MNRFSRCVTLLTAFALSGNVPAIALPAVPPLDIKPTPRVAPDSTAPASVIAAKTVMVAPKAAPVAAIAPVKAVVEKTSPANASVERLAQGGQTLIALNAPATRIALGDPAIADVRLLSPTQLRLVGLKPGNTDLTVWSKSDPAGRLYTVVVGPNVAALKAKLAETPALQDVTATATAGGISLEGQAPNLDARQKAGEIARAEAGDKVGNQVAVADQRMIAVEVRFAAVSTNTMRSLGLNFQKLGGGFQFATGVPGSISSYSLTPGVNVTSTLPISQAFNLLMAWPGSDIGSALSALSSANLAQVLAEPTLLVRSGDDASFLAGGEIPIPVPQTGLNTGGAIAIQYRKFGVQLHVHATAMSNDRIVIRVNPEVSELDYQNALTLQGFNVPAIRARSTDTTIELGNGQSFVLAGLMYGSSTNIEEKVPGLGSLPIVGEFFKRTQLSHEQQELVIIATPRLVSPMAANTVPKLPGEGLAYDPSLGETLLNTRQLDTFVADYGLAKP